MFKKIQLLFNTIKFLKFSQILNRLRRRFIKPKVSLCNIPQHSFPCRVLSPTVKCTQKIFGDSRVKFLNKEFTINGKEDWNAEDQDKLWLYNLHYFDDLNAANAEHRLKWHVSLIQKWINENPVGAGNGWEPYPSSLRIVNWIKWLIENQNSNNISQQTFLDSLVIQTRFLSKNLEFHLLGNHLFSNAKALVYAGLFFTGQESDTWYKLGVSILKKEISEQVLSDGGNFELSPMYHAIFLEDLLDLVNIHQAYEVSLPSKLGIKIEPMLEWLECMCHPDSDIAFFNDATLGVSSSFGALLSYAKRLGYVIKEKVPQNLIHLKASGYIRAENDDAVLISDVANIGPDYLPGHGHADALSFELSLFNQRLIINSGISTYEIGLDRSTQRGTQSHSTITIDNQNSSEVWSGFRVANRAKIFNIQKFRYSNSVEFSACHDGYKKLKGKIVHCRKWSMGTNSVSIVDNIWGSGVHQIKSILPVHPNVELGGPQGDTIDLQISGKLVKIHFEGAGELKVIKAKYYPSFGCAVDNKHIIYDYIGKLPSNISIKISW